MFDQILFIPAGDEDNHKSLDKFEFRRNSTTDFGLAAIERLKKI